MARFRIDDSRMRRMFDTHSHSWREVGLARQLSAKAVRRARLETVVLLVLIVGVVVAYELRERLFGVDLPVRVVAAVALVALGWAFARDVGRSLGPALFRRMDPAAAGTVGFLIRLVGMAIFALVALRIAGLENRGLVPAAAATAVILGLAAQQTLGNVFAGIVLLSARPFVVGDRVRLQGGDLAGELEGTISSLGLLHTVFANGDDLIMVPNRTVLGVAIIPLREPAGVNLRARLRPGVTPADIQQLLHDSVRTPMRGDPRILLEEIDGDEVVVRVQATPDHPPDGAQLASEVLAAVSSVTRRMESAEEVARRSPASSTRPDATVDYDPAGVE
jgi:small-conductance mechanosensitive channel